MPNNILYIFISVILVSLISFIGILTISLNAKKFNKSLLFLVSFATGALLGDTFIHIMPKIYKTTNLNTSIYVLSGIGIFFILEKFIHWQHCHRNIMGEKHIHPFAYINLIGDGLHNLIDGLVIGASYIISIPLGIATTSAVILHEIPQEIGDLEILLHGGFSKTKALFLNFLTAITAIIGASTTLLLNGFIENIEIVLTAIAAGGFIYIAGSDLIPELHKETNIKKSFIQLVSFILGIALMASLLLLE